VSKARRLVPALLLLAVSALALAACGGSENDEDKVISAVETAATGSEPSKCTEVETPKFVEQSTGETGKKAIEACEKEAEENENAESVDVSDVEVEGEEATATAAITGGQLDGQTLVLAIVKEEGDWKVNEAVEFKNLDHEKLIAAFKKSIGEEEEIEPALAECLVEGIEEGSNSELEGLILDGPEGFVQIAESCTGE
jgi:hypothetical protein